MNQGTSNPVEAFRRLNSALAGRREQAEKDKKNKEAAERAAAYRAEKAKRGEPPYITSRKK